MNLPGDSRGFHLGAVLVTLLVGLLSYLNSFDGAFAYDDNHAILRNPHIRWAELSLENVARATLATKVLRPVAHVSFGLNYYIGSYDPFGYHVLNLVVHLATGLLVYVFALFTFRRLRELPGQWNPRLPPACVGWMALFAALFFVAHPLQTQAVTYIVQRMSSLATLFYLAALLLYVKGRRTDGEAKRWAWWVGGLFCWTLALGSKEIAVTLPFAIWLYEWYFLRDLAPRWAKRSARTMVSLAVIGFALGLIYTRGFQGYGVREFSMGGRLLTETRVLWIYIGLLLAPLPSRLNLLHDVPLSLSLFEPLTTLPSLLGLAALFAFGVFAARRWRLGSFAILWFFLHLALESSFLPLLLIYEHRMYLPMVGIALFAPYLLFTVFAARPSWAIAVASIAVVCLGAGTYARNEVWRDAVGLWRDVAAKSPGHPVAWMNLGGMLATRGEHDEALEHFFTTVRLDPEYSYGYINLGASTYTLGRFDEATAYYEQALALEPKNPHAHSGFADVLVKLGRYEEAAMHLEAAFGFLPDENYLNKLGMVRGLQGRLEEALGFFVGAHRMNPRYWHPLVNAGATLANLERYEEAIGVFEELLRHEPNHEVSGHLGNALWQLGRFREGIARLEEAVRLRPGWLIGLNNLAWMLATCEDEKLRDPERAIQLAQDGLLRNGAPAPGLLDTLGAGYAAIGRFDEAVMAASQAAALASENGNQQLAAEIETRLAGYRAGRSYIEDLAPRG